MLPGLLLPPPPPAAYRDPTDAAGGLPVPAQGMTREQAVAKFCRVYAEAITPERAKMNFSSPPTLPPPPEAAPAAAPQAAMGG